MAEYGREWAQQRRFSPRRGPRRTAPRRFTGYGREPGFEEGFGYDTEVGYGAEMEFGPGGEYQGRRPPEYGYDFEYGGRGWPYRRAYREERGARWGGAEPERLGPSGFRRAWGRAPLPRGTRERGLPYGREFARHGRPPRFAPSWYGEGRYPEERFAEERFREERFAEEEFPAIGRAGREPRYGHTPADRWPETGHDLDHLEREELEMNDGDIREAVLENLFQDTWINPDRIDIDVDRGVVTLTGEVRDFMEARYAWDDAWESAGVRGVVNNLTVRADLPQEGMELPQTSGSRSRGGGGIR